MFLPGISHYFAELLVVIMHQHVHGRVSRGREEDEHGCKQCRFQISKKNGPCKCFMKKEFVLRSGGEH